MARDDGFPESALTKVLHLFLSKKAEDWYWIFKLDNPDASWQRMKAAMMSYFSSFDCEEEIREQIFRRHQNQKESFSDFALNIQKLNARLQNRLTERDIIHRLCQNMVPALRNVTLPAQHLIRTVEELRVLCQRYERMWDQTGYDPRRFSDNPYRRRQINELCDELQRTNITTAKYEGQPNRFRYNDELNDQSPNYTLPHTQSIEVIQQRNIRSKGANEQSGLLLCWNCKDLGHRYQDCEQDFNHIFCFGCGAADVRKPNCANCLRFSSENIRPSVNMSRVNHSGRNMSPHLSQQPMNTKKSD